jgi:hypothetical protein
VWNRIKVAFRYSIEEREVGGRVFFCRCFSVAVLEERTVSMTLVSTYNSSNKYGGAPKEVRSATLTDGTALAPRISAGISTRLNAPRAITMVLERQYAHEKLNVR